MSKRTRLEECEHMINEILLDNIDIEVYKNGSKKYIYNDKYVPRVTEILHSMVNEDYITRWANNLGFKKISYKKEIERAARIGTFAHESIEKLLRSGVIELKFPEDIHYECTNAVMSFKRWYEHIQKLDHEILSLEEILVCPWFGGTLDMLIRINNKIYLVDFKTSNHISYRYILQLAAYKYMLDMKKRPIDGMFILKLFKNEINFEETLYDLSIYDDKKMIQDCTTAFISFVHAYYNKIKVSNEFDLKYKNHLIGGDDYTNYD